MDALETIGTALGQLLPVLVVGAAVVLALWWVSWLLLRRTAELGTDKRLPRQLFMLALTGVGVVLVLLVLPVSETTRGQLLGLLGLVLTGIIALSSTTFVANAMAGLMIRSIDTFRPGDFVRVGEHFGRVTERGLFYTEIQTEQRDLVTLPNLYLSSNPVAVVRSSGTILAAEASLGYDVPHARAEALLLDAARAAGLEDPFAQVMELGNFAVTYRVSGFLGDVKQLIPMRSSLRQHVLDALHAGGIEIASPTLMATRPIGDAARILPEATPAGPVAAPEQAEAITERMFDKAEEAEALAALRFESERLAEEIEELKAGSGEAPEGQRARIEREIGRREARLQQIADLLQADDEKKKNKR